ncbi:HAMP domain-containing sensor histidine kinase [Fictibacillus phosphorivorans]|uniref:HAMP domain-containing sensor histidine kinase n=1 Tax=Fictibacillus phosphorivorans TaxID=1221500 RepID=UPI00203EC0FA|nr:ATP-binding protein [Fictibacillus phosphorivorans]MCM3718705.1 ATP-binding protein [Fictibacillus phosphorivorans]MCM3776328.1 ATP-binding protein [Fictibacillus phosphorivorans]
MEKMIGWLRLKNMTLLQSFIFLCSFMLLMVLSVIVLEFKWAESIRQQYPDHPLVNKWALPSLVAIVMITVAVSILLMASLFYRWKLKKPLEILMKASNKISANELDFHIYYDGKDEFGELCLVFEKMRSQLEKNFKTLWRSVEERKQVNAIFAHDLRTPLSVLKGYSELLTTYLPRNNISEEKLLDMIQTMKVHIIRLESYTEAMNSIQKLEDMPVQRQAIALEEITSLLNDSAQQIMRQCDKRFVSTINADSNNIRVDLNLVMQVFENVIANGARYATSQVRIDYSVSKDFFSITIMDDGAGFSETDLQKAVLPFYRGEVWDTNGHHGLGLYICKILCEKHDGSLHVENGSHGGAKITASFFTKLIKS